MRISFSKGTATLTTIRLPADCATIDELRKEIDRLDEQLIDLLAKRWTYVDQVWRRKLNTEIGYPQGRSDAMLEKACSRADAAGLPPWVAEGIWREIIRLGIEFEKQQSEQHGDVNN